MIDDAGCCQQRGRPRQSRHDAWIVWWWTKKRAIKQKHNGWIWYLSKNTVMYITCTILTSKHQYEFWFQRFCTTIASTFPNTQIQNKKYATTSTTTPEACDKYVLSMLWPSHYLRALCTWGLPGRPCWLGHPTERPRLSPDPWGNVTPTPGSTAPRTRPGCTTGPGTNLEDSSCFFM